MNNVPFSRFFSHYAGQIYKVSGALPADDNDEKLGELFKGVVREMFEREYFSALCNTLSCCAFAFVAFTENGEGRELDKENLLADTLGAYGIETTREELLLFAQNFWAQSMDFKIRSGWTPPSASDLPDRVFEAVGRALGRSPEDCRRLLDMVIAEWKPEAKRLMRKYGYEAPW